ncbi:DUF6571 family protein [Acrocarpospora catenulata]|uniref:DUF6571 family protein n=1 Tax=Acrocarpospora catenulata TaxID=2836182 RepID=UPI001BD93D95|nr:DUF6571 family protein [Acrocarpospora catenulata]
MVSAGSGMVGIDPTLMTQLINQAKRAGTELPSVSQQIDQILATLNLSLTGPGTLRDIGHQIGARVPDLQRRLDLILAAPEVELGGAGILWADDSGWLTATPAAGAAEARLLADRLRVEAGNGKLSAETLADLNKYQNDPYFAAAFARELPNLKGLFAQLFRADVLSQSGADTRASVSAQDQEKLAAALSGILGTASRLKGTLKVQGGYADRLIEDLGSPETAFALNKLLRYGTFEETFLLDLATKVYDYERSQPAGTPYWQTVNPSVGAASRWGATVMLPQTDPMAAVMAAFANNPAAAQDFFTDPKRKPLAYLMRERDWRAGNDDDLGRAIEAATTVFRDHEEPPRQSRGWKSALIAAWAVHFWKGEDVQRNLPNTRDSAGRLLASYVSDVNSAMRWSGDSQIGVRSGDPDRNLAGVQPYGADFTATGLKQAMTWAFTDSGAFKSVAAAQAQYSAEVLDAQAAKLKDEVDTVFAKWKADHPGATAKELDDQRQEVLEDRMNAHGGQAFSSLTRALASTFGVIVDAGAISDINEAKKHDANVQAFADIVNSASGLVPLPNLVSQNQLLEWGIDQAKEAGIGQISSDYEGEARSRAQETRDQTVDLFRDITAGAMMRHGLFGDGGVPAVTHPYSMENSRPGTVGDFLRKGEIVPWERMTTDQQRAYIEWITYVDTGRVFFDPESAIDDGFKKAEKYYERQ